MSREKLRIKNTQLDNLTSNLRGEVGEIITSWILLRQMMQRVRDLSSDDMAKDMQNQNLAAASMLRVKLSDEIVARLSELAEQKIGRLTFHFAAEKLGKLEAEVRAFRAYITRKEFHTKRNQDISHKELPETWSKHGPIRIPYQSLRRAIGHAIWLMKKIDRIVLGPATRFLWGEARKKRYQLMDPGKVAYMLLPYMNLAPEVRERVILEEMAEGRPVWSDMKATLNGEEMTISACREWGAFFFQGRLTVLPHYPLQKLDMQTPSSPATDEVEAMHLEPIIEARRVTAMYRVTQKEGDSRMTLSPCQRVHRLDGDGLTELVDITLIMNDKLTQDFGNMKIGDEKEFTLNVNVVTGLRLPQPEVAGPNEPAGSSRKEPG